MTALYSLTESDAVIRNDDGAFIPDDPRNPDWVEYQVWLAAGGAPDPSYTPVIVPALNSVGTGKTTNQILGV